MGDGGGCFKAVLYGWRGNEGRACGLWSVRICLVAKQPFTGLLQSLKAPPAREQMMEH